MRYVSDSRNVANPVRAGNYAQLAFPDAYDSTDGGRFDLEWALGDHFLRVGYDEQNSESKAGQVTSGPGYRWIYESVGAEPTSGSATPSSATSSGSGTGRCAAVRLPSQSPPD